MFLQFTDLYTWMKEFISCPFMLSLVAFCLDYWLWPYEPPLAPRDALLARYTGGESVLAADS
jgi:hypothetical protein